MTVMADFVRHVELAAKGKAGQGFTKAPKGRLIEMIPDRE